MSDGYWLGIDLGGTKMLAVLYDGEFTEVARERKKTKGHEGVEKGIRRICGLVESVLQQHPQAQGNLRGIGIGCPSPIDVERGVVVEAVNLGWKGVPLRDHLTQEFACPVSVLNDVDAGVYAEYQFGAGRDARGLLGVFPGTGIGGGAVVAGEVVMGRLSCMEIGHVRVMPEGNLCGCGRRGCLETVASRLAISAEAAKAAFRGEAPYLMKQTSAELTKIRSGVLAEAIRQGDVVVEQIIRNAARWIGIAVADCIHLLSVDRVVLGGGLVEAMPELFVDEVGQSAEASVMRPYRGTFNVAVAQLGDDATVRGAAAWAAHRQGVSISWSDATSATIEADASADTPETEGAAEVTPVAELEEGA